MVLEAAVAEFLNSAFVKAVIAVFALAAAASPVFRYFHDRAEQRLRVREVVAQERMAAAAEKRNENG